MEYYLTPQNTFESLVGKEMHLETITLSEIHQTQRLNITHFLLYEKLKSINNLKSKK